MYLSILWSLCEMDQPKSQIAKKHRVDIDCIMMTLWHGNAFTLLAIYMGMHVDSHHKWQVILNFYVLLVVISKKLVEQLFEPPVILDITPMARPCNDSSRRIKV